MTGVEKGFFEATLFTLSMILHLSHSLEGERDADCKIRMMGSKCLVPDCPGR